MTLQLCTQADLLGWMNELPLGGLLFLVDLGPSSAKCEVELPCLELEGRRLSLGFLPVAPFRATDAEGERVAQAMGPATVALTEASTAQAWFSVLLTCRPAGAFIPEAAIPSLAEAPPGTVPPVWRPVAELAP